MTNDRSRRLRPFVCLAVALALLLPATALAEVVTGDDYTLEAGKVHAGNLYAFGQTVRIDGTLDGDLVAGATKVLVGPDGQVKGDVLAGAQGVIVEGRVDGDVRAAAFTVQVADGGSVGGEVVGLAFSVGVAEGSTVGGDFLGAAYQALLDGDVGGDFRFSGSGVEINGHVSGDVAVEVDAPSEGAAPPIGAFAFIEVVPPRTIGPGLSVSEGARIDGQLDYSSPQEVTVPSAVVGGRTSFEEREVAADKDKDQGEETEPAPEPRSWAVDWLIKLVKNYVALVVFGLLFALLLPRVLDGTADLLAARPAQSFGWGIGTFAVALLLLFVIPLATIAIAALIGALHIGPLAKPVLASAVVSGALATAGVYLASWFGRVIVGQWFGRKLLGHAAFGQTAARLVPLLVGLLVYAVLVSLPWVGFLIKLVLLAFGIGSFLAWLWRQGRACCAGAPPEVTV